MTVVELPALTHVGLALPVAPGAILVVAMLKLPTQWLAAKPPMRSLYTWFGAAQKEAELSRPQKSSLQAMTVAQSVSYTARAVSEVPPPEHVLTVMPVPVGLEKVYQRSEPRA